MTHEFTQHYLDNIKEDVESLETGVLELIENLMPSKEDFLHKKIRHYLGEIKLQVDLLARAEKKMQVDVDILEDDVLYLLENALPHKEDFLHKKIKDCLEEIKHQVNLLEQAEKKKQVKETNKNRKTGKKDSKKKEQKGKER